MGSVLEAADRDAMLAWLTQQSMALHEHGLLMVHGGVLPSWTPAQVLALAREVESVLRGPGLAAFLPLMYGNEPAQWDDALTGPARLRVIVNALTRLRFCTPEGRMDMKASGGPGSAPAGYIPWFDVPGRRTADVRIAFGHWSTLGYVNRPDIVSLDTGCVWGGCLSALEIGTDRLLQVDCEQAQAPGE
jgi:bis(5'-nucleosyl)-tetraphosphatase (symmetrical)